MVLRRHARSVSHLEQTVFRPTGEPRGEERRRKRCVRHGSRSASRSKRQFARVSAGTRPTSRFPLAVIVCFRGRVTAGRSALPSNGRFSRTNRCSSRRSRTRWAPNWAPAIVISSVRWEAMVDPALRRRAAACDTSTWAIWSTLRIRRCRTTALHLTESGNERLAGHLFAPCARHGCEGSCPPRTSARRRGSAPLSSRGTSV